MRVSIFTPTNNTKYLSELYDSIKDQPFDEWVIVENRTRVGDSRILADARVRRIQEDEVDNNVGTLKKKACKACTGDILVELDHDDLLMDGAVSEVRAVFEENTDIGFAYSNTANFTKDFENVKKYGEYFGWVYRNFPYKNHVLHEHVAFKPTPASVSRIWWAPNHVRAWRADVYRKIGGHNPDLQVLDDLELIMRTYLVTKFRHIDKCLYLYRVNEDGSNTWLKRNKEIQQGVYPLYDKYIYRLVERWSDINGFLKIDLGGRFECPQGYRSVDRLGSADYLFDLNERWEFDDNSVGVLRAHDVIEHLADPIHVMKEAYRVLVPGGYFMIKVPSTDGRGAFQDPTHRSFFNENSFWYYTRREQARYIDTPVRFQAMRLRTDFPSDWCKTNNIPYVFAHLQALKGQEVCGGVDI